MVEGFAVVWLSVFHVTSDFLLSILSLPNFLLSRNTLGEIKVCILFLLSRNLETTIFNHNTYRCLTVRQKVNGIVVL